MEYAEYRKRYDEIEAAQAKLAGELEALKAEYIKGCKYKRGDKIKLTLFVFSLDNKKPATEERIVYVSDVNYGKFNTYRDVQLEFAEVKKDGKMSSRIVHIPWSSIKAIDLVS